jgi:hypothetical protein
MSISIEKNEQSKMTKNLIKALDKVKAAKATNEFTNELTPQQFNLLTSQGKYHNNHVEE